MTKTSLPIHQLERTLRDRIGQVEDVCPIGEGEESQAVRFRHKNEDFVLRINPNRLGFDKDQFAQATFGSPALPIPEVIDIWPIASGETCCVTRLLEGRTLQDLESGELYKLLAPTAATLNAIAVVDVAGTTGYGPFDAKGRGGHTTWRDYLVKTWLPNAHEAIMIQKEVNQDRIDRVIGELEALANSCPEERGLVHGDFGSNNVLAVDDKITGVIDWSEAMYGDPLYDIANVLFWRSWLNCMEIQARYFDQVNPDDAGVRQRLRCYQLRIGLDEIHLAALRSKKRLLKWALHRCDEIMAEPA